VVAKYLYDPYGNTLAQSGLSADANTYRFSSKEWNANSGLYYYLYRFYDSILQRWLNRDPVLDYGSLTFDSTPKQISRRLYLKEQRLPRIYNFVINSPTTIVDAFGLQPWMPPGATPIPPGAPPGMPGFNPPPSGKCPCPPGQTLTPYWQIMGYESESACATAEWQLNRDTIAGGLGAIGGGIIGTVGGGLGIGIGAGLGAIGGGTLIPNAICNQQICN